MKSELEGNDFVGEIEFKNLLKNDTEKNIEKAKKWAEDVCKKL